MLVALVEGDWICSIQGDYVGTIAQRVELTIDNGARYCHCEYCQNSLHFQDQKSGQEHE